MLTSSTSLSSSASVGRDQKSTSQVVSSMECFFLGSEWGWHLIVVGEGGLRVVSLWSCFASLWGCGGCEFVKALEFVEVLEF